jgi:hypothetical protein
VQEEKHITDVVPWFFSHSKHTSGVVRPRLSLPPSDIRPMAADSSSDDEGRGHFDEDVDFFSIEEGGGQKMAERKTGTDSSDGGDRRWCRWAMLGFGPLSIWVIVE